ncbi:MAG: hypothetical protein R2873_26010 [Caldilineaceae bacterium]
MRQAITRRQRRPLSQISIRGACANNLQNVDVDFAKGALTVVTGVSRGRSQSLWATLRPGGGDAF